MKLKVISFNIHKGVGWGAQKFSLSSIRDQLRENHPDIILIQETRGSQFEFLAEDIWPHFSYGKNAAYPKGHHGNAIISKFPIEYSYNLNLTTGRFEKRGLLHTITHHPKFKRLHIFCVHLGLFKTDRRKQFTLMRNYVEEVVTEGDLIILGGDFNDWSGGVTNPMLTELGFEEVFNSLDGRFARTFPAWAPLLRLDRIYCRGFKVHQAKCLLDPSWRTLSDHAAIEAHISPIEGN